MIIIIGNVQTAADGSSLVYARARLHKRRVSCHEIMVILCVENPTTTASTYRYIYIYISIRVHRVALLVAGHVRYNITTSVI